MGRTARAGVRVGLFACLCLCRERPPCEGFIPSVTAEGIRGENLRFSRVCRVLPVASWPGERGLESFHICPEEGETRRKGGLSHLFEEFITNRGVRLPTVRIELRFDRVK